MQEKLKERILPGGIPTPLLREDILRFYPEQCQNMISNFTSYVWMEQKEKVASFPDHVVAVGENWLQFTEFTSLLFDLSHLKFDKFTFGKPFRASAWPIMHRGRIKNVEDLILAMQEGVKTGNLKNFQGIAVIDCCGPISDFFQKENIAVRERSEWGEVLEVSVSNRKFDVYRITSYQGREQREIDLGEIDGARGTLFLNE